MANTKTVKTMTFWLVILMSATLLWQIVTKDNSAPSIPEISYSEFLDHVEHGDVVSVSIAERTVRGKYRDGKSFQTIGPAFQDGMIQNLRDHNVEIWLRDTPSGSWSAWISTLAPLIFIAALWFFLIRQMQASQKARLTGMQPPPGAST